MFYPRRLSLQGRWEPSGQGELCLVHVYKADRQDEGDGRSIIHSLSCRQETCRYQHFHRSFWSTIRGKLSNGGLLSVIS
jgi:hypothetical protein